MPERGVMTMSCELQTEHFRLTYSESDVEDPVLWERHCHGEFEMIAVLEGDVSVMAEGRSYRLVEHQTVFLPPLLYHTVTANKKGRYRRVTALFDVGAVPGVLRPHFDAKGSALTIFEAREPEALRRCCAAENAAYYAPLAEGLMMGLFYGDIEAKSATTGGETDDFLQKLLPYIDAHLSAQISLDDLATLTARSKSSLCHLFEERMGTSPKQYILQKKLALATKLIRNGIPPTEAALRVGYDNYSSFYRLYKKYSGAAPSGK
ncbi:MAG: helix-turn-helix transcriptional regulator [Clostridia bacterium]|nr:helix-turn-helix transcriptional regulator [Clostridia bacterium]